MRSLAPLLAAAALLTVPSAAGAANYTVTGGKLDWTIANQYSGSSDQGRTWLGYATNTTGPGAANGKAEPTAPATATGPTGAAVTVIDSSSPRGLDQLFTFGLPAPVTGAGTYTDEGVGSIELLGKLTFTVHNIPITLENPLITLDGLTGTLKASGSTANMAGQVTTYDRTKTQFTLDLSNATVTLRANGARTINGIVPVSTADTALAGFAPNSRRFGTMSLTLGLAATPVLGSPGPAGPAGPAGKDGKDGRDAEFRVVRLARAPFATKSEVRVRLLDRTTGKVAARGTVQRNVLRLGVLSGTSLKGSYRLQRVSTKAAKRTATITIS